MSENENSSTVETTPPDEPTEGPASSSTEESTVYKASDSSKNFLADSFTKWLPSLIDQPTSPPFARDAAFADEFKRIAGLLVVVVVISTIIISGVSVAFGGILEGATLIGTSVTRITRISLGIVVSIFLISLIYYPIANAFRVRISNRKQMSLRQIFFTALYIIVPWLPIFAFIWTAIIPAEGTLLILLLLSPYLCIVYIIYNFVKAIRVITDCPSLRIWASVIFPFAACVSILLLLNSL